MNNAIRKNNTAGNIIVIPQPEKKSKKPKGKKSEVFPFEIEDLKKMIHYFISNEMWIHYLAFIISCNMARRIGDTLSFTWDRIFDPATGDFRQDLLEIKEQKTDKLANPHINSACRDAINLYIEKTGCDPAKNNYGELVFLQLCGTHKGKVLTSDGHLKAMKKAASDVGIKYNVGTHSPRKTFGKISRMLHPADYDSMELLQTIYNHSDVKTTKSYIGLTREKVNAYYDSFGDFFGDYITGDKTYEEVATAPIVSLDTNDLRLIISKAYESGTENANEQNPMVHVNAINDIMRMIEGFIK